MTALHLVPGLVFPTTLRRHLLATGERGQIAGLYDCFDIGAIPRRDDPLEVALSRGRAMAVRSGDPELAARAAEDMAGLEAAMAAAEQVTLWAGESLQDQFALAFATALAAHRGWGAKLVLRQVRMAGPARSLGAVVEADLEGAPAARPLTGAEAALYPELWEALQAPTPEPLLALRRTPALPAPLGPVLDAHFARFPHAATGLGARDERVLAQLSTDWRTAPRIVASALAWWEDAVVDAVGDLELLDLLRGFARRPEDQPIAELREDSGNPFGQSARLTPFGAALAAGAASLVDEGGIDAQIGGVRMVSGAGPVWLRTGGAEILARLD